MNRIADAMLMGGAIFYLSAAYWADTEATRVLAFIGVVLSLTSVLLQAWRRR